MDRDIRLAAQMVDLSSATGMTVEELAVIAARRPDMLDIAHNRIIADKDDREYH